MCEGVANPYEGFVYVSIGGDWNSLHSPVVEQTECCVEALRCMGIAETPLQSLIGIDLDSRPGSPESSSGNPGLESGLIPHIFKALRYAPCVFLGGSTKGHVSVSTLLIPYEGGVAELTSDEIRLVEPRLETRLVVLSGARAQERRALATVAQSLILAGVKAVAIAWGHERENQEVIRRLVTSVLHPTDSYALAEVLRDSIAQAQQGWPTVELIGSLLKEAPIPRRTAPTCTDQRVSNELGEKMPRLGSLSLTL